MEKMGAISLLGCISISLVAMQDTHTLRDMVTQQVQRPLIQTHDEKEQEAPTCVICFDDMTPGQNTIHTRCTDEEHIFHMPCLARWYAKVDQGNHKRCPTCREPFKPAIKKKLEKEGLKIKKAIMAEKRAARALEEAANPALRIERERKEWWARFLNFTALGLGLASVVTAPLVLKEYVYGTGAREPIYAQAASIIVPTTVTVALPLAQSAQRLEEEIDS